MHASPAVGLVAVAVAVAAADPGPQLTEIVRVRPNSHDPSWPPVLIFCVAVVVLGALFAAVVFLRRAWNAAHPSHEPLDG
jgi:hypothetical protein